MRGGCEDEHLPRHHCFGTFVTFLQRYCLCVVVDATYESCVEDENTAEKFLVKSKLAHLKVCDRSQRSFCFAKSFFRTREISGRSKVKPVEGLCDKHHRLWPSRSALTQNYVEGFQLFREDQIVLPLLMGEPPIGKEWMLLLIHHCQHDIKVRQSAEIIQTTGATRSNSIGASDKKILLVFRIMSSLLIATPSFN